MQASSAAQPGSLDNGELEARVRDALGTGDIEELRQLCTFVSALPATQAHPLFQLVVISATPETIATGSEASSCKCSGDELAQVAAELTGALGARLVRTSIALTPKLTASCWQVSLAVLRAHRSCGGDAKHKREQDDISSTDEDESWTEHRFSLTCFRIQLHRDVSGIASQSGCSFDVQPDTPSGDGVDVSTEICRSVPDVALLHIAGFVEFLDVDAMPPNMAAIAVRGLLWVAKETEAEHIFRATFARSRMLQALLIEKQLPRRLLRIVSAYPESSLVLREMLSKFDEMSLVELCDLIEDQLLTALYDEVHCHDNIIRQPIARDLVLWLRSGGASDGARLGALAYRGDSGDNADRGRARSVGVRLFKICFLPHAGFLVRNSSSSDWWRKLAGEPCITINSECAWDSGALDLQLLLEVPVVEDALQLARQVVLRNLRRLGGQLNVWDISRAWPLGRWPHCKDPGLIAEAFDFLSSCWRALTSQKDSDAVFLRDRNAPVATTCGGAIEESPVGRSANGCTDRFVAEELVCAMFGELEVWRLPLENLLTPWVPGQVLVSHVATQCRILEEHRDALAAQGSENLSEVVRLRAALSALASRLEEIDAKSQHCMQKQAELNDWLRRSSI